MSHRRLAQAKTKPKAYEIPTWAIADAIRRRADKAKAVVRDDADPPQRPDDVTQRVGPEPIPFEARGSVASHARLEPRAVRATRG